jgi:hypothetical protein
VRRIPFSCFALLDKFSAVRRTSGPVFMFCTSGLVFCGTEGVASCFHVFSFPDSFSGPALMFCVPGLVFDDTEGVRPHFHVLPSRTHFLRY